MTKLDTLKKLATKPIGIADIEDAYSALIALPGLLSVCDAHVHFITERSLYDAAQFGYSITNELIAQREQIARRQLEELLG